ncbi:MAG: hypothetical protein HY226_04540 [Candidatus Vogelbacteria bacterium]|nr:hypothetical protein [Candidatus Vogelbacteria bacterium]
MEQFLTKNVLISILAGILIIAGAFWSRLSNAPQLSTPEIQTGGVSEISYQKNSELQPTPTQNSDETIKVANLPDVNGLDENTPVDALTADQKFLLTPSPSTLPYEEITDKSTIYSNGTTRFKMSDISTTDTNRASLLTYGKKLVETIDGYPYYVAKSPTEITLDLSKKFSDAGINSLETIRASYDGTSKNLINLSVPDGLSTLHIDLANSFDRTAQLINNMEKIQTDKLLAMNNARQYIEESKITLSILLQMNKYYKDNNVDLGEGNKLNAKVEILN